MLVGKWNRSVILTYIGLGVGVLGIYLAICHTNILYSFSCFIIAGVCDLFDGFIARKCERTEEEKSFGVQIDSLVDVINFLALPIVIFINMGFNNRYHVLIYILFCLCGVVRLGYFNILVEMNDKPVKYYQGLPVTYSALIFPLSYLLYYVLNESLFSMIYPLIIIAVSILNIVKVKIIKPKGISYLFFSILAIIMLLLYLVIL